ncbi:S1 family peptidase [Longispora urticae]
MRTARSLTVLALLLTALTSPSVAFAAPTPEPAAADPARSTTFDGYAELARSPRVPGTAWWTDPATGRLVAAADDSVTGADLSTVAAAAYRAGATLVREPGLFAPRLRGGEPFYPGRCAVAFNVRSGTTYSFLTAAHCVPKVGGTVYADPALTVVLGVVTSVNTGYDLALVRYTNPAIPHPGDVTLYGAGVQDIASAASGSVGQAVRRSGPTTGVRAGSITGLNATVNYPGGGSVVGLIRTNICAEPGDSGGPLYAGSVAIGILSGGSGNCSSGGTTFYASVTRAQSLYGVTVY